MDQISTVIAGSVGSVLIAAIIALWRFVLTSNRKCEARNDALDIVVMRLQDVILARAAEDAKEAHRREEAAWERARALSGVLRENSEELGKIAAITETVGAIARDASNIVRSFCDQRNEKRSRSTDRIDPDPTPLSNALEFHGKGAAS